MNKHATVFIGLLAISTKVELGRVGLCIFPKLLSPIFICSRVTDDSVERARLLALGI